jgi:CheY-like chemotaxis protein
MLENYGYRVLMAENGAEALTLFRQYGAQVRAVILDSIMPFMDGPATLRALRELDPKIRVVGVSGLTAVEGLSLGDRGAQAFLTKPYTAPQLLAALRQALSAAPPAG